MSQDRSNRKSENETDSGDSSQDFQKNAANETTGAAGDAAARRMAKKPSSTVTDLGEFDNSNKPGPALKGRTEKLKAGDALKLRVHDNQIWGIYGFTVAPSKDVHVDMKLIKPMNPGQLGDTNVYEFTLTMAEHVTAGTKVKLTSQTAHQSWSDPGWNFSFVMESE